MKDKRYGWRFVAAIGALAMVASACGDGADDPEPEDPDTEEVSDTDETSDDEEASGPSDGYCERGGEDELVWVHEQEPPDLHLDDPANNLGITSWIRQAMLEGAFGVSADTTFIPELVASHEVTQEDGGDWRYTFTLRDDLRWSDGTPLTAEDVRTTYDILMEGYDPESGEGGVYLFGSRSAAGYAAIDPASWEVDGQTYSFTTEEFFAGYQQWFDPIYPAHVIPDAQTANEVLREWEVDGEPLPSSGPMIWDGWERGVSMTLTRNDDYHGANPQNPDVRNAGTACVSGVEIVYVADTDAQITALLSDEADFVMTQPQVAFGERIASAGNFTVASEAGPVWEHWGFNTNNAHLSDPDVREAIAYSLDKRPVMEALYSPLFGDLLPETGLGNAYWMSNQPAYVDQQGQAGYGVGDADSAAPLFETAGYALNADGIWEHPEKGTLTLRVGTTGGNQLRELQIQIMQQQLLETGIEIEIDNVPGGAYFAERPFAEESVDCSISGGAEGDCTLWDITQFAWLGGPWPGSIHSGFLSGSPMNPYGYANEDFDALTAQCDSTVDADERADCYNELSSYVTTREIDDDGLVVLPITQTPSFFAYSNERLLEGAVAPDANSAGPLANVVDYLPAN